MDSLTERFRSWVFETVDLIECSNVKFTAIMVGGLVLMFVDYILPTLITLALLGAAVFASLHFS